MADGAWLMADSLWQSAIRYPLSAICSVPPTIRYPLSAISQFHSLGDGLEPRWIVSAEPLDQ